MAESGRDMRRYQIHRFRYGPGSQELFERFLDLRARMYADEYYFYPENETHRFLFDYYAQRPDYRYECLLLEDAGEDIGRVMVGKCEAFPWVFFGFFECRADDAALHCLTAEILHVAKDYRAAEIRGPMDFNGAHGWQFLQTSTTAERLFGDPYHKAYYPDFFVHNGWEIEARSNSGILRPEAHTALMADFDRVADEFNRSPVRMLNMQTCPPEQFLPDIYRLISTNFAAEAYRYVPIEQTLFEIQTRSIMTRLKDPNSLILCYDGDRLACFTLSYCNFIDDLCNPLGNKPSPDPSQRQKPTFAVKTIIVDRPWQGGILYPYLNRWFSDYAYRTYGHPLAWRRVNASLHHAPRLIETSILTQKCVSFRHGL